MNLFSRINSREWYLHFNSTRRNNKEEDNCNYEQPVHHPGHSLRKTRGTNKYKQECIQPPGNKHIQDDDNETTMNAKQILSWVKVIKRTVKLLFLHQGDKGR